MIVRVLITCHTQYSWDRSIGVFLFNRTTHQVFVTYLTGALFLHPLWFCKHQHDNWVRSKMSVACQWWWFQWCFAAILVNCAPSREIHNYCTPHIIKGNFENFLIHWCKYSYLKCIVYDKLLKPRQSFLITLYFIWYRCRIQSLKEVWCKFRKQLRNALNVSEQRVSVLTVIKCTEDMYAKSM
jgi:hypothetical protein